MKRFLFSTAALAALFAGSSVAEAKGKFGFHVHVGPSHHHSLHYGHKHVYHKTLAVSYCSYWQPCWSNYYGCKVYYDPYTCTYYIWSNGCYVPCVFYP